jgi:hypothetical protein
MRAARPCPRRCHRPDPLDQTVSVGDGDGAEATQVVVIGLGCGADDGDPALDGELYGDGAHTTCRTVQQQRFAGVNSQQIEHPVCGFTGDRQRNSLVPGEVGRLVGNLGGHRHRVLCVGTRLAPAEYLIADGQPGDPGADLVDDAGHLAAGDGRKGRGEHILQPSLADFVVAAVHPDGYHPKSDLIHTGVRLLNIGPVQYIRAAKLVISDRVHAYLSCSVKTM